MANKKYNYNKRIKKMAKKKKYSYNDRKNYHSKKYRSFVDRFRKGMSLDFKALDDAEQKLPKIQYSSGFCDFTDGIERGYTMPADELKKESAAFQRGYEAAKSAFEKSRNIKF